MVFVIPYFIPHQGCPHQCLFCNQNSITGKQSSVDTLKVEIEQTIRLWLGRRKKNMVTHFSFYGGSFTCLPASRQERMLDVVAPFIKRGEIDQIRLSTRPDCIDDEICRQLKEKGVGVVELGVQSMDNAVLAAAMRGHTEEDCVRALQRLEAAGIEVGVQLMPGLPRESRGSFMRTVKKVIRLSPAFVRLYPALVVKDSGLEKLYQENEYVPLSLNKAVAYVCWARQRFTSAGIKVVRMGLQPSVSLEQSLVAGPYHPAFGELVVSRDWFRRVKKLFADNPSKNIKITISTRDLSSFNGLKRSNIKRLESLGLAQRLQIIVDKNIKRGSLHHVVC